MRISPQNAVPVTGVVACVLPSAMRAIVGLHKGDQGILGFMVGFDHRVLTGDDDTAGSVLPGPGHCCAAGRS